MIKAKESKEKSKKESLQAFTQKIVSGFLNLNHLMHAKNNIEGQK